VGWASFNKNFSFVREALEVMCSPEFNVTGVLVANKNKAGTKACTIPAICHGRIVQTTFLEQKEFFGYLAKVRREPAMKWNIIVFLAQFAVTPMCITYPLQARWAFLPQVCDASPRVSTQAMAMDVPLLMNRNIMGGWKYLVPGQTGEFFHDISDFKDSLRRILDNTRGRNSPYKPLEFFWGNYGNKNSGKRLLEFVKEHWGDRMIFPEGTNALIPTGA